MLTKGSFTHSKISEFSITPNSFCRIENMKAFCKWLIIRSMCKMENVEDLRKIYSCTTITSIVVQL